MSLLAPLALVVALFLLVACAVLALECLAACLPVRRGRFNLVRTPRFVVLVPAHDEEDCLPAALRTLETDLSDQDRVLVVAHNCGDRTADVARAHGAEVLEVRDAGTGGKPDALKAGLAHLDADPPEVVVIVDADCRVEPGSVRALAAAAAESGGPVQGDYRFGPGGEDEFSSISSLALLVKNVVRPQGLTRLGLPCLLNGAGSAYPFAQIRHAPHGEGSIAEDYQLAIDLAAAGHPTRFVPEARVRSVLPGRRSSALRQRRRWEHGHLALFLGAVPRLLVLGLLTGNRDLFVLGIDLLVPPLAFLVLAWGLGALLAGGVLLSGGGAAPLVLVLVAGLLFGGGVCAALLRFAGGKALRATLRGLPGYVGRKLPLYLGFFGRRETRWQKTERTSSPDTGPADTSGGERAKTGT